MRALVLFFAVTVMAISTNVKADTWNIDTAHANALFKVKHMMISNVTGKVSNISGTVELDPKDITKSKVEATLDAATINTNNQKRDEHLRSPDFFDTTKFPQFKFTSTKVSKMGKGGITVDGDLTIRGVTKPVSLTVEGIETEIKDPMGNVRRGLTATTSINRKDWGITWNKAMDGGGVVVGEKIDITLEMELIKASKPAH